VPLNPWIKLPLNQLFYQRYMNTITYSLSQPPIATDELMAAKTATKSLTKTIVSSPGH
jgi:hypothetical protein